MWRLTQNTEGCFRVYNDWPSEFCTTAPDRLLGVDLLPMKGPIEWAIEEAQPVAKKGLCSVGIPSWIMGRSYRDPSYNPLWATLQELGPADFLFTSARMEPKTDEAPSVYFERQFWATLEDDRAGILTRELIGVDRLLWVSDCRHTEGTFPYS